VPEAAHILFALRVALLAPAVGIKLSLFVIFTIKELANKLGVTAGDGRLLEPVLGLGVLVPVLIVVVPVGVFPLTPLVANLLFMVVLIVMFIIVMFIVILPVARNKAFSKQIH
jgi:hypothetical protein